VWEEKGEGCEDDAPGKLGLAVVVCWRLIREPDSASKSIAITIICKLAWRLRALAWVMH
jgi:hypothetical protein